MLISDPFVATKLTKIQSLLKSQPGSKSSNVYRRRQRLAKDATLAPKALCKEASAEEYTETMNAAVPGFLDDKIAEFKYVKLFLSNC